MSQAMSRYPTPFSSPNASDSGQANNPKMARKRHLFNTAPLTPAYHLPFEHYDPPAPVTSHQPPFSPSHFPPNGSQERPAFGGRDCQAVAGAGGAREIYGEGQQQDYQEHPLQDYGHQQYSWGEQAFGGRLYPTPPPQEAGHFQAGSWYAPQPQYTAPQHSWWMPYYQQPLTQYSAAPWQQQQDSATTDRSHDGITYSFTLVNQQISGSVAHQALFKRLGIDKAARYSQNSSTPVPAAPTQDIKKKEKKPRKSKAEKRLAKSATAGGPDLLTDLEHWSRAQAPQRGYTEVGTQEQQQTFQQPVTARVTSPRPKFDPRETKRLHVMQRPEPRPSYVQRAMQPAHSLGVSRPLLVILDLNGTLLFRKNRSKSTSFVARPHVSEFLQYLFANHVVMVWSSSKPENVNKMCSTLFTPDQRAKVAAVWGRDKLRIPPDAYNSKVQVYKQLSWVWNDLEIQASNPVRGDPWTQANTVLIDDSIEKSVSEPFNLVELEEFEAKPEQMTTDVLGQVALYLDDLRSQRDVSAYMRQHPFVYDPRPIAKGNGKEVNTKRDSPMDEIDMVIKRATGEI